MRTYDLIEAATLLKMSPETLRQRAKAGRIQARKPGRRWAIPYRLSQRSNNLLQRHPVGGGQRLNRLRQPHDLLVQRFAIADGGKLREELPQRRVQFRHDLARIDFQRPRQLEHGIHVERVLAGQIVAKRGLGAPAALQGHLLLG